MGSFTNTNYRKTTESLVTGLQNRLANNPYYLFTDKKPTTVTYWNINDKHSTLDQGDKEVYHQLGENTPLRYNKIKNFQIYGIERMMIDLQRGEFGPESPIEGEAIILPNTIIPCVDDYFMITYLRDNTLLFRVNSCSPDTLESGANFYKIRYNLETSSERSYGFLNGKLLVNEFEYMPGNVGTNLSPMLLSDDAQLLNRVRDAYTMLKSFYINLFYKGNIQTFVYGYLGMFIYDPYLIEFLIRTGIFSESDDFYLYISQAVHKPDTFAIEYSRTIFRDIENVNPKMHLNSCYPVPVHDPNSLLVDRMEEYWELSINLRNKFNADPINWISMDLFDRIVNNNPYTEDKKDFYKNIIINYMNKTADPFNLNLEDLESLECKDYYFTKDLYYEIPMILYMLRSYMTGLQSGGKPNGDTPNAGASSPEYQKYLDDNSCNTNGKSYLEGK